jgi:hypothetical protein
MRSLGLLLCCALLAASPADASGFVVCKMTGDPWDAGFRTPSAPCEQIRGEIAYPLPESTRQSAVTMLQHASVRPLGDRQAAELLQQTAAGDLFTNLLTAQVTKLQAQRNAVFLDHVGGWSDADTVTTSDLVELFGPHYPPYRPYLVRALAGARTSPGNFNIHLCGDTLLVANISDGERASRFPLIVFLQAAPTTTIPSWCR